MKTQKQITVNQMILNTLLTKLDKEPKYKEVLETLGYEIFDSDWSSVGNWSVRLKGTDTNGICISRDRGGKRGYFKGSKWLGKIDAPVDFANAIKNLTKSRWNEWEVRRYVTYPSSIWAINKRTPFANIFPADSKVAEYLLLKTRLDDQKNWCDKELEKCQNLLKEYKQAHKNLSKKKEQYDKKKKALDDFLNNTIYAKK